MNGVRRRTDELKEDRFAQRENDLGNGFLKGLRKEEGKNGVCSSSAT
jgi:hypothetical protein